MTLETTIQRLTNDGELVVQFLVDTLQGNTLNATVSHRLKSAEWLTAFGELVPEDALPQSATVRPRPKSKPKQDKPGKADKKPLVTEKQILHFDIARLIKDETSDGESIIRFLIRVVAKIEKPDEHFTPAARIRAARELLIRGFGSCIPGINRILSGKTEELDSYLSKTIRECTGYGADPIRFLIDVMENESPEIDSEGARAFNKFKPQQKDVVPSEGFKALQRVWAACELFRRGYDIRTDHITYADIQAYWNAQTPTIESDDHEPDYSKLGITREDVEAEVAKMRAADAAKAAANATATTEKPAAKPANPNNAQDNQVSAEKPAAKADNAHSNEQPAANAPTSSGNSSADTRAARRREKRAARKAQKPANNPARPLAPKNQSEEEAALFISSGDGLYTAFIGSEIHELDLRNHANASDDAANNNAADIDSAAKPALPPQSTPRPRLTRAERRRIKRQNRKRPPNNRSP